MMLQVTKIGIAKPWRLTIILARGRAIRPAYEGIETASLRIGEGTERSGRAIRPAYEGIETRCRDSGSGRRSAWVARSAPPMRGLKRYPAKLSENTKRPGRAIRPAYEGIET